MCGIAGFLQNGLREDEWTGTLRSMADSLVNRGPDDNGIWADAAAGAGLAHRRLSILDLSTKGRQPMHSASGRLVISYNGEVYNFQEIRRELERKNISFKSNTDTEVILEAVEHWGLEEALNRFVGMFAFAIWDRKERQLHLVRDRLGIKPLYYGRANGSFLFASELKALRRHPKFSNPVNRNALLLFMRHGYIPSPHSIYENVHKLQPGHFMTIQWDPQSGRGQVEAWPAGAAYWDAKTIAERAAGSPFAGDEHEALDELETILTSAVKLRLIADVPLGAFLSGGIDSSTVVALMRKHSASPVKTFTIGFHEDRYNEAQHAEKIAEHLETEHTELYVTPQEAMSVIPKLPSMYDEPFADSSQIPTYLVSQLARLHVTVSLSGDGGDEMFCGYDRYEWAANIWRRLGSLPPPLRRLFAGFLRSPSANVWSYLQKIFRPLLPPAGRRGSLGNKARKLAVLLEQNSPEEVYFNLISLWKFPHEAVIGGREPSTIYNDPAGRPAHHDFLSMMMYMDARAYMVDDILTKVDRASMAIGLEARVPVLDHRVVEFAWRLPNSLKYRNGKMKWLLRKLLSRYVPGHLFERPKMGFGVPIDVWLRGPLREWASQLLDESRIRQEGYFHFEPIRQYWNEHVSGRSDRHYELWNVLMFQAWLDESL